jgi:ribosomal protein S18 acetylase RimI-like enzyme
MKFKFITPAHAYYRDELMLRWEVLRKPLGMPPGSEVIPEEMECIHLLALDEKKIVGCVLFHPESDHLGRIVQVALSEDYRGKGCGRKLLQMLEQHVAKKGTQEMYLYAREEYQPFFERMGFHYDGSSFFRYGAPCRTMKKSLALDALRSA